jgi:hypothetical protein
MSESYRREYGDIELPPALDAPGDRDAPRPSVAARLGAEWGLASLLMGGLLFLCCPIMLIFNFVCYSGSSSALGGNDLELARIASVIVFICVTGVGGCAVGFGVRGWQAAVAHRQPQGLPLSGLLVSGVGLLLWLMVGCDTQSIMFTFF